MVNLCAWLSNIFRRCFWFLLALLAAVSLTSCDRLQAANPNFSPTKAHHTPTGFRNNHIAAVDKPFLDLLRWRWSALLDGLPPEAATPTPTQAPDLNTLRNNGRAGAAMQPSVTWIGHATTLVQASGLNVLTDPIFSERASPVQLIGPKRQPPPGVAMQDLPHIDVVVISHNHFDHLDWQSVFGLDQRAKTAGRETVFLVPLGLKAWFANLGIERVVELDWWDKFTLGAVDFHLTAGSTLVHPRHGRPKPDSVGWLGRIWAGLQLVFQRRRRVFQRFCRHKAAFFPKSGAQRQIVRPRAPGRGRL